MPTLFFQRWLFGSFRPRSLHQRQLHKNCILFSLPWSKMVLVREYAVTKIGSANYEEAASFSRAIQTRCVGEDRRCVDLTFDGQWHASPVRRQAPCIGRFACLGIRSSLANRTRASFDLAMRRCQNDSSKVCWLFGSFGPRSLHQGWLHKNSILPTSSTLDLVMGRCPHCCFSAGFLGRLGSDLYTEGSCTRIASSSACHGLSKMVLVREYAVTKIGSANYEEAASFSRAIQTRCVGEDRRCVDLTFDGQWHASPVRRQAPCIGRFACLGIRSSLANRTGASFDLAMRRCQNDSSKVCWLFGSFGPRSLHQGWLPKNSILPTACHGLKWS